MATETQTMDAHAMAIGYVTWAWTDAHEQLGHLFSAILHGELSDVALAAWHSHQSDREQRDMLQAAANTSLVEHPKLLKKINWLVGQVSESANERNNAIHASFALVASEDEPEIIPETRYGNRRAKQLEGLKSVAAEFERLTKNLNSLATFCAGLFPCVVDPAHYPLPKKPSLPRREGRSDRT